MQWVLRFRNGSFYRCVLAAGQRLGCVPMPLVAALLALLLQVSCMDLYSARFDALEPQLSGDGYTWLPLVEARIETGRWSPVIPSHNAPYGVETHLTRPFAEAVRLLALPLGLFLPPKEAALFGGMLSGPTLQMATAALVAWGAAAVVGPGGTVLAVAAFLVSWHWALYATFSVYAYDHHALHLCLGAAILALLLRHAAGQGGSGRMAGAAGAVAGIGIWAGTEMLLLAGVGGGVLGLAWMLWGGDRRAQGLWRYAAAMAATLGGGLLVERSPAELSLELDRLSGTHVVMGVLLALASVAVALSQQRWPSLGPARRGMVAASSAAAAGLGLWFIAPDFFRGPYAAIDDVVQEYLSSLLWDRGAWSVFSASPGVMGYYLLPCILAAGTAARGLGGARREACLVLLVSTVATAVFPFWTARLIRHFPLFVAIPLGGAAAALGWWAWNWASARLRVVAGFVVLGVLLSPYLGLVIGDLVVKKDASDLFWKSVSDQRACDWRSVGRALASVPRLGGGTIVTHPQQGADLAYLSGLGVVATGCHCNAEGMADALAILTSQPEASRALAERRGVEFIVLCPGARGIHGHDWYLERSGPDGLYARLARGQPPDWLARTSPTEIGVDGFVVHRATFLSSLGSGMRKSQVPQE